MTLDPRIRRIQQVYGFELDEIEVLFQLSKTFDEPVQRTLARVARLVIRDPILVDHLLDTNQTRH